MPKMQPFGKIRITTKGKPYDCVVGKQLLPHLGEFIEAVMYLRAEKMPDKVFFVSDSNVWPLYGKTCEQSVEKLDVEHKCFVFSAGEESKNPRTLVECLEKMAEFKCTRDSLLVTLGGGVACDLGGFAAATYMRGIRVLQIPTSLLAMVDASVGGKTAVDLPQGKNLFGAFHQPICVLADTSTLTTLSDDQFQDAVGEIVKQSLLGDREMFEFLCNNKLDKTSIETEEIDDIVIRNIEVKRDVVNADEFEGGIRQTLNLGHTVGHAIETANNYTLGHGTCVAAGLGIVAQAGKRAGITPAALADKIVDCLKTQGLPHTTDVDINRLVDLIAQDKKRHSDSVNFVVVKAIENCQVVPIKIEDIAEFLS